MTQSNYVYSGLDRDCCAQTVSGKDSDTLKSMCVCVICHFSIKIMSLNITGGHKLSPAPNKSHRKHIVYCLIAYVFNSA